MDFNTIANDHAADRSITVSPFREVLMMRFESSSWAAFYDGLNLYQIENKPSDFVHRFKRLFNQPASPPATDSLGKTSLYFYKR